MIAADITAIEVTSVIIKVGIFFHCQHDHPSKIKNFEIFGFLYY